MIDQKAALAWLDEAARYFASRPAGGEDAAFWANVANRDTALRIAELVAHLGRRVDDLLEANNRYLSRARTAEHALADQVFSTRAEMSAVERIKLAHGVVTDAKRDLGEGGLELLLEAVMMNLIMASGTGAGGKLISDLANKVSVQCGNARPGSVRLRALEKGAVD